MKLKNDEALADIGTTDYFLKEGAPANDIKIDPKPIKPEMPNGAYEKSTHMCELRIPGLPKELRKGHIVPSLSHLSLLSMKKNATGGVRLYSTKIL